MSVPSVSVVVPAFDEADVIGDTLQSLRRELPEAIPAASIELIVVDDGSSDDTAGIARSHADIVVESDRNRGKGHAVRTGVAVAGGDVVVFCDADLAYGPRQVAAVVRAVVAGADAALGSRRGGGDDGLSGLRRVGNSVVSALADHLLLGRRLDTQCGLKAFAAPVARDVFARCHTDGFAFDIEVIHLLDHLGASVVEVPVAVVNRTSSSVRPVRHGLALLVDIVRIRLRSARGVYGPPRSGRAVAAAR